MLAVPFSSSMDRARDSRTRILCAAGLLLCGALLGLPMAAVAEPPATDEYTLELPGALEDTTGDTGPVGGSSSARITDQVGTSGEALPPQSALDSASSLIGGPAAAIAAAALALLVLGALAVRTPRTHA
jgi:hypothetical protein